MLTLFSDGILEVLPQQSLEEKEQVLLQTLQRRRGTIKRVCTALGLDEREDIPDDIAVLLIAKKVMDDAAAR